MQVDLTLAGPPCSRNNSLVLALVTSVNFYGSTMAKSPEGVVSMWPDDASSVSALLAWY